MSKVVQVFYKDIPNYYDMINPQPNAKKEDLKRIIDKVNKANGGE